MDAVLLTTFIDFVCRSGTPKMTVVKEWKSRDAYDPAHDYYKRLREGIIAVHEDGKPLSSLDGICAAASESKRTNYVAMVEAYKKWNKRKTIGWFSPTKGEWKATGMVVQVNPELGLVVDGKRHLVKLYFKAEPLAKNRAELVLHLLDTVCAKKMKEAATVAILDVRNAKLFAGAPASTAHALQLEGEAAYWMTVWSKL